MNTCTRVVIFCFLVCGEVRSECELKNEEKYLHCSNVTPNEINNAYNSRIRDRVWHLSIENITMDYLAANSLKYPKLKSLKINGNVSLLNEKSIWNLRFLGKLNLRDNKISDIPQNFFQESNSLEELDLGNNKLRNVTLDTFWNLNNLEIVHLDGNEVNLELGVLDYFIDIEVMDLSRNKIKSLPLGIFDKNVNLEHLDLSQNKISELELGLFDTLKELKHLNLHKNMLSSLSQHIFDATGTIEILDLSSNKLENIKNGTFSSLKSLVELNLSGNKLTQIWETLFSKNEELRFVDFSNNQLTSVPPHLFAKNENLQKLNFSNNNLEKFPQEILSDSSNLEVLDLSYNSLTSANLTKFNRLYEMYLQNNKIEWIDVDRLYNMLKIVDIRRNGLTDFSEKLVQLMHKSEQFEILGNLWECSCFQKILNKMNEKNIKFSEEDYFNGKQPICRICENEDCDKNCVL